MLPLRVREDPLCLTSAHFPVGATMNQALSYLDDALLPKVSLHAKLPYDGQERTLVSRRQRFLSFGAAGPAGTNRIPGPQ